MSHTMRRRGAAALVLMLIAGAAPAADYALSADGNAVVRVVPQTSIGSAGFDAALVTAAYPGWTVTTGGTVAGASITPGTYAAGWQQGAGGATFTATYSQTSAVAAGHQLHWLQIIDTNQPLGGSSTRYIDPRPNDDNLPFYWTTGEVAGKSTSTSVGFSDYSKRGANSLSAVDPVTWNASLYAVEYDGNQNIAVRGGVTWGWTMKPATVGASSGSFTAPTPSCPPATCSGLGTSTVNWGIGEPGSLSFASASFSPVVGDLFKLGTLTYHNGATQVGTALDAVGLDIAMNFANVTEANFVYHSRLAITNTPNTDDPAASADYVQFTAGGFTNTFNVIEGRTASVDLMARLTPALQVTPSSAGGSADKDPFGSPDPALLGFQVELVGFANATAGGFISAVPEPSTLALWLAGLCVAAALRRRA